jgi:hypothetical protein
MVENNSVLATHLFLGMKTIQYRFVDKSEWPRGIWDYEADKLQWQDPETGLPCLAVRNFALGHWCGYIAVAQGHPWFGKQYDHEAVEIDCHGGLTFSDFCAEDHQHGICHVPAAGEPDKVWWFGFDCAHAFDLVPTMLGTLKRIGARRAHQNDVYRDLGFVQEQCAWIARQLVKVI